MCLKLINAANVKNIKKSTLMSAFFKNDNPV